MDPDPPPIQICTKVGRRRYDLRFKIEHKKSRNKMQITLNNNNESKYSYKDLFDIVVVFVLEIHTRLRSY